MDQLFIIFPLAYWVLSYAVIMMVGQYASKKLKKDSVGSANIRSVKFISTLLVSISSIALFAAVWKFDISTAVSTYFMVPYFGILAYFFAAVFRELKGAQ